MDKIKIILVDDQILIAQSLKVVLEKQSVDMKVIGIAQDGQEALDLVGKDKRNKKN